MDRVPRAGIFDIKCESRYITRKSGEQRVIYGDHDERPDEEVVERSSDDGDQDKRPYKEVVERSPDDGFRGHQ